MAEPSDSIQCSAPEPFAAWMATAGGTIAVSTYQAGKLVLISWDGRRVAVTMRHFPRPMGMTVEGQRIALATRDELWLFNNAALLAPEYLDHGRYDALFLPRCTYLTGPLNLHDMAFAGNELWVVNTRFSCLATISSEYSFVPRWHPRFITELAPEDRCHLNGLAMVDGKPKFVTCLAETNRAGTWRRHKTDGGMLIDVESGEPVVRGLCMPHSPRWYRGRLWLLNSGAGQLCTVDLARATCEEVCTVPGYVRGLCFVGKHALVGLSKIRESRLFEGLPIQEKFDRLLCGVAVIDVERGKLVGVFEFTAGAEELYDVQFLSAIHRPSILNTDKEAVRRAITAPEFAYWLAPEADSVPTGKGVPSSVADSHSNLSEDREHGALQKEGPR
jgi:uncharacterized protein (TIGR03032 family)